MSEQFTPTELLAALKVEHERSDDECVRLHEAADAIAWAQRDSIQAEQQRAETFMRERDDWQARYEALAAAVRKVAERMDMSGVKFDLLELTEPLEARP